MDVGETILLGEDSFGGSAGKEYYYNSIHMQ